jgi:hypothetical protein
VEVGIPYFLQLRGEGPEGQLEPDLVVALAGGAVRDGVAAGLERHLGLVLRDQRPREGRSEEIGALVDGVSAYGGKDEVADELLANIAHHAVDRSRGPGLLRQAGKLLLLADVGRVGDDLTAVVLLQPVQDDGRVEPAAVGETDLLDVARPGHGGDLRRASLHEPHPAAGPGGLEGDVRAR